MIAESPIAEPVWAQSTLLCTASALRKRLQQAERGGKDIQAQLYLIRKGPSRRRDISGLRDIQDWLHDQVLEGAGFRSTLGNTIEWELSRIAETSFDHRDELIQQLVKRLSDIRLRKTSRTDRSTLGGVIPKDLVFQSGGEGSVFVLEKKHVGQASPEILTLGHDRLTTRKRIRTAVPAETHYRIKFDNKWWTFLLFYHASAFTNTLKSNPITGTTQWFVDTISVGLDPGFHFHSECEHIEPWYRWSEKKIWSYVSVSYSAPLSAALWAWGVATGHYVDNNDFHWAMVWCDGAWHRR